MKYYGELKLNFQKNNCLFYEWNKSDKLVILKKILCYNITSKQMGDIIANKIKVQDSLLKSNYVLVKDRNCVIALSFDSEGMEIGRSYLGLDDELKVLENNCNDKCKFVYEIISRIKYEDHLRVEKVIRDTLINEFNKLIKDNNYGKLNYLYMEWFNDNITDNKQIIININNKLKAGITDKEVQLYELIQLSYKEV